MRRKYDLRNKRNFLIIFILSAVIICIFSLFIYKYLHTSKIFYTIETGSVLQDVNKNYITVDEDAILKMRWNDSYYLIYQDNKINLGKKVIVYDTISSNIKLYGKFYEINENGEITLNKDETILTNTTDTKFYKLDDREYLLVDRNIVSDDRSISANDYLLVELDKMGNAKLSNYKLNLKTISPTILVTSKYSFDIANEILKYEGLEIDLKKIIGTTNKYDPSNDNEKSDNNETNSNVEGNQNRVVTNYNTGNTGNVVNNNASKQEQDANISEIISKTKMTSVIRPVVGLTQIDVDYVIYDPYNEYKTVYAEIVKPNKIEVVYLSKTDTHVVFDNLMADTEYKINFIYTTADSETGEIVPNKFDEMTLKTKMPEYSISVYKLSTVSNLLTYKVNLQEGFSINRVNVNLSFNYRSVDSETGETTIEHASLDTYATVNTADKMTTGMIDISGYNIDQDSLLSLKVVSVTGDFGTMDIGSTYNFRFGR